MSAARLLTIAEVANRLSVTERHVRRLIFERRIPYVKVGRLVRFDPPALERWIDDGRHEPDSITLPSRVQARLRTVPNRERRHGLH